MMKPVTPPVARSADGWKDSRVYKPRSQQVVSGWTGRFLVKCSFDHDKQVWITTKGTVIKVYTWNPSA